MEYQRTLEKDIETRIQTMLERIVGVNKAVVRVSSVLDFRKIETTEERYDPNGQVVRSEQRGQEKSSGVNGTTGGVPAWNRMCPAGGRRGGQTSSNNNQTKNETVNYEISRTVSRIVEPTGTIKSSRSRCWSTGRMRAVAKQRRVLPSSRRSMCLVRKKK